MTPQEEADRATLAFHAALTAAGVAALQDGMVLFNEVPPNASPAIVRRWLKAAIRLVATRRQATRDLAMSYYRYVRAIHTGATIADPYRPKQVETTLPALREEFYDLATTASNAAPERDEVETPDTPPEGASEASRPPPSPSEDDEADRLLVEELKGLAEEEARIEAAAEEEARIALEALGPLNQQSKIESIPEETPVSEADALRERAHIEAAARQAAAVERLVRDGARSTLWTANNADKRAIGYVRYSTSGTPCGWCAMLISRGPVYKSEKSATFADGDKYHDNCRCEALPVFSDEEYSNSTLFTLNREYSELWPQVTAGLSGKAALTAWRRYIRQSQKAASTRTQAVRSTSSVQEA